MKVQSASPYSTEHYSAWSTMAPARTHQSLSLWTGVPTAVH